MSEGLIELEEERRIEEELRKRGVDFYFVKADKYKIKIILGNARSFYEFDCSDFRKIVETLEGILGKRFEWEIVMELDWKDEDALDDVWLVFVVYR